jgi:hypothetical protein
MADFNVPLLRHQELELCDRDTQAGDFRDPYDLLYEEACAIQYAGLEREAAAECQGTGDGSGPCCRRNGPGCCTCTSRLKDTYLVYLKAIARTGIVIVNHVAEVYTICVYFRTGNKDWGTISTAFVAVGWLWQLLLAVISTLVSKGKGVGGASLVATFVFSALNLGPAVLVGLRGNLHDREVTWEIESLSSTLSMIFQYSKLVFIVVKSIPNLVLHCYVLLVNQLSSHYESKRLHSLDMAAQVTSVAPAILVLSATVVRPHRPSVKMKSMVNPVLFVFAMILDVTLHCFRIAVLAAAEQHLVVLVIVMGACIPAGVSALSVKVRHSAARSRCSLWLTMLTMVCQTPLFALSSLSELYLAAGVVCVPSALVLILDSIVVSALYFGLALLVPLGTDYAASSDHLHGICGLSASEGNDRGHCFPVPLVAAFGALIVVHLVGQLPLPRTSDGTNLVLQSNKSLTFSS